MIVTPITFPAVSDILYGTLYCPYEGYSWYSSRWRVGWPPPSCCGGGILAAATTTRHERLTTWLRGSAPAHVAARAVALPEQFAAQPYNVVTVLWRMAAA
eukprot:TRINITY_DN16018_c0_g2_i2.p1 TRINITY_DN16018_c0_g2~~TRINITY_DN16018_c0_g2_i2.p1  ORF type:complete len:100 (+),score=7.30 TRINITY_DN16018_c0_g2_i2:394-693(+)